MYRPTLKFGKGQRISCILSHKQDLEWWQSEKRLRLYHLLALDPGTGYLFSQLLIYKIKHLLHIKHYFKALSISQLLWSLP